MAIWPGFRAGFGRDPPGSKEGRATKTLVLLWNWGHGSYTVVFMYSLDSHWPLSFDAGMSPRICHHTQEAQRTQCVEAPGKLDLIMIPKVGTISDVYAVDMLCTQVEDAMGIDKRMGFELIIETAATHARCRNLRPTHSPRSQGSAALRKPRPSFG